MSKTKAQTNLDRYKSRVKQIVYSELGYTKGNFMLLDAAVARQYPMDERQAASAALQLLNEWETERAAVTV